MMSACSSATPTVPPTEVTEAIPTATVAPTTAGGMPEDPVARDGMYNAPPPLNIDTQKIYLATFKLEKGDIVVQLLPDKAPYTVNNFIFLARNGFYDNTTFHRVIEGFMAQGGDPTSTGMGGPGYTFKDEISDLKFDDAGILAMANAGPNTNGSQFFLTFTPAPWLDGQYTIFGKVIEGMDVLNSISPRDPQTAKTPGDLLKTVTIEEADHSFLPTPTPVVLTKPGSVPMPENPTARYGMYSAPPEMVIDPSKAYTATIVTEKGDIVVRLFPDKAPKTVNNLVFLSREGFYNNTTFHRVIEGFMAQGGDPTGTGMGGPGYTFEDEISPDLKFDSAGILAMANAGPGTNGSQFFLTFDATPWLDGHHTIFGKVVRGMDVLKSISLRDPQTASEPGDLIKTIRITEGDAAISSGETGGEAEDSTLMQLFTQLQGEPYDGGETSVAYPGATNGKRLFPTLGKADAPVTMIEFSEILCGHCQDFNLHNLEGILKDYVATGKVRYVGHYMAFNRTESQDYLAAAMCAAEQGRYFEFEHAVYQGLEQGTFDFTQSAQIAGLDIGAFQQCQKEGRYKDAVQDASQDAFDQGINATPSFLINGQLIQGNLPDKMRQAIDKALQP